MPYDCDENWPGLDLAIELAIEAEREERHARLAAKHPCGMCCGPTDFRGYWGAFGHFKCRDCGWAEYVQLGPDE